MTAPHDSTPHALLYEPRVEGHHLVWLRFIVEDLLTSGWKLTLALDPRSEAQERIQKRLGDLIGQVSLLPAFDEIAGQTGSDVESVASCFAQSNADIVFLNSIDEIASSVLRRAAIRKMPPAELRGRLGGIYLRPRFLAQREFSPNAWLKALGFAQLMRGGWFTHLLFLDPQLKGACEQKFPHAPVFAMPDPFPDNFETDAREARRQLEVPDGRRVFLFYGGAYRRKGLHLAVEAMLRLPESCPAYLFCAGEQSSDAMVEQGLQILTAQGRARVIRRYIFEEEEKQLFAASDAVLLPYLKHFGASAVLSRAVGARRMVIASDEEFIGQTVRENELGLLFRSGDATALRHAIAQTVSAGPEQWSRWRGAAENFAPRWTRAAFRSVLVESFRAAAAGFPAKSAGPLS